MILRSSTGGRKHPHLTLGGHLWSIIGRPVEPLLKPEMAAAADRRRDALVLECARERVVH